MRGIFNEKDEKLLTFSLKYSCQILAVSLANLQHALKESTYFEWQKGDRRAVIPEWIDEIAENDAVQIENDCDARRSTRFPLGFEHNAREHLLQPPIGVDNAWHRYNPEDLEKKSDRFGRITRVRIAQNGDPFESQFRFSM